MAWNPDDFRCGYRRLVSNYDCGLPLHEPIGMRLGQYRREVVAVLELQSGDTAGGFGLQYRRELGARYFGGIPCCTAHKSTRLRKTMLKVIESEQPDLLHVLVSDKPALTRKAEEHNQFALLWEMRKFKGWNTRGGWEDLQTDQGYNDQARKIAVVGGKSWQECTTKPSKLFANGELRHFDANPVREAHDRLEAAQ